MRNLTLALVLATATATFAHEGVHNPVVEARMHHMLEINKDAKTLFRMAKGEIAFNASAAQTAATKLAHKATRIEYYFQLPEDDPQSEALPVIWQKFDDFSAKANAMQRAADVNIRTQADLLAAAKAIGATCAACHTAYTTR